MTKKTLVINDLHLGVQRSGGTTLESAAALREFAHDKHVDLLQIAVTHGCQRIIVNGDLADAYDIALLQALEIYRVTDDFMSTHTDIEIVWALGNHDLSKSSEKLGSVAFIGALLAMKYKQFTLVDKATALDSETYVIPHVPNQDLFELELDRVPDGVQWLLVHCNLDNKFACDADHSLDLSRDRAKALKARGVKLVFGHEHQGRETLGGSVIVVGNQFPTSVSDCLAHGDGQKDGKKRAMILDGSSHEFVTTWTPDDADGWFAKVDWRELAGVEEEGRGFVRVEGTAETDEAAEVIRAISTFRQRSKSFVVTNAVKVAQVESDDDIAASIEDIKSLSVLDLLMEQLTAPQQAAVKKLIEESQQ